jgi:putative membrane protein
VLTFLLLGTTSGHMAVHIGAMSVVAPFAGIAIVRANGSRTIGVKALWLATLVQAALLWATHSPPVHQIAHSSVIGFATLQTALFLSAVTFWTSIIASPLRWHSVLALLVSGKLACLLGALLIFSPRVVLVGAAHSHHTTLHSATLADQQLAGLLMVGACPLSYVLAALVLAAKALTAVSKMRAPAFQALPQ